MSRIIDPTGKPFELTSKTAGVRRRWAKVKPWMLWVGGLLVPLVGGSFKYHTAITAVWQSVCGNHDYSSPMSEEEIAEVISMQDASVVAAGDAVPASLSISAPPAVAKPATQVTPPAPIKPAKAEPAVVTAQVVNPIPASLPVSATTPPADAKKTGPMMPTVTPAASRPAQVARPAWMGPVEVTSVTFNNKDRVFDVMVRNTTDEPVVVSQIIIRWVFVKETSIIIPSGTHDLGVREEDVERARSRKQPFEFERGFNVGYEVKPKGVARYLFTYSMSPGALYRPEGRGRYVLEARVTANRGFVKEEYYARVHGNRMHLSARDRFRK
jgi:hypothetical protein